MGSVVYVGRGAFRMEAVGPNGLLSDLEGVVQPVTGVVTAPYHGHAPVQSKGENTGVDRLPVSATFRAPDLQSLFGSQVDVPVLAAPPTGEIDIAPSEPPVALPMAALAGLGAIIFACGAVIGAAALRPHPAQATAQPAAITPAPQPVPVAEPAPVAPQPIAAPAPELPPVTTIAVAAPVKIAVHKRPAPRRAAVAPAAETTEPAAPKPWVDPFAE